MKVGSFTTPSLDNFLEGLACETTLQFNFTVEMIFMRVVSYN